MKADNLQRAVYGVLNADATLSGLVVGVYADVADAHDGEDESLFPYVTLGPETALPWDTHTNLGAAALVQVDIWSRQNDYVEAKNIATVIHGLLHYQSLTITGASHVMTTLESTAYMLDPDGKTHHGAMTFRVVYDDI